MKEDQTKPPHLKTTSWIAKLVFQVQQNEMLVGTRTLQRHSIRAAHRSSQCTFITGRQSCVTGLLRHKRYIRLSLCTDRHCS